jgi:hypothetical protein
MVSLSGVLSRALCGVDSHLAALDGGLGRESTSPPRFDSADETGEY